MTRESLRPYGKALRAYFNGNTRAELLVHRDDGFEASLPAGIFFRDASEFSPLEEEALRLCRGEILDVGAGAGCHSLVLQEKGFAVTAIDITPECVHIMQERGIEKALLVDFFQFNDGPFDTMLFLGHGIGLAESLSGLARVLEQSDPLLSDRGQILLHSLDIRVTDEPRHLAYHEENRKKGRYIGETCLQFSFEESVGAECSWLHVDPDALEEHATRIGWRCKIVCTEETGDYLALLTR